MALAFEQQPKERSLRTATVALPFEQQPKESAKAFAAFSLYLSLGPERSHGQVAEKLGKSKRMMEKWSTQFDWPARVQAHGAHMARIEREAAEALARAKGVDWVVRQEEQREKEWALRCRAVQVAEAAIERWLGDEDRCGSLEGIARMLELVSKLGRLASGMATDRTEVKTEVEGKIDVEWEMAIKRVYGGKAEIGKAESRNAEVLEAEVVTDKTAEGKMMDGKTMGTLTQRNEGGALGEAGLPGGER